MRSLLGAFTDRNGRVRSESALRRYYLQLHFAFVDVLLHYLLYSDIVKLAMIGFVALRVNGVVFVPKTDALILFSVQLL